MNLTLLRHTRGGGVQLGIPLSGVGSHFAKLLDSADEAPAVAGIEQGLYGKLDLFLGRDTVEVFLLVLNAAGQGKTGSRL